MQIPYHGHAQKQIRFRLDGQTFHLLACTDQPRGPSLAPGNIDALDRGSVDGLAEPPRAAPRLAWPGRVTSGGRVIEGDQLASRTAAKQGKRVTHPPEQLLFVAPSPRDITTCRGVVVDGCHAGPAMRQPRDSKACSARTSRDPQLPRQGMLVVSKCRNVSGRDRKSSGHVVDMKKARRDLARRRLSQSPLLHLRPSHLDFHRHFSETFIMCFAIRSSADDNDQQQRIISDIRGAAATLYAVTCTAAAPRQAAAAAPHAEPHRQDPPTEA